MFSERVIDGSATQLRGRRERVLWHKEESVRVGEVSETASGSVQLEVEVEAVEVQKLPA